MREDFLCYAQGCIQPPKYLLVGEKGVFFACDAHGQIRGGEITYVFNRIWRRWEKV